jgi:FkbM family methyltransferase
VKAALRALARQLGYRIEGIRFTPRHYFQPELLRRLEFDDIVCRLMFERGSGLTFVQIGSYDGVSTDPLRKYIDRCGWRGVLVEPQSRPAAALRQLYADRPEIVIIEAAVDSEPGRRTMFTVEGPNVPAWAGGMASFNREHLLRHDYVLPGISHHIRETEVPCVTFEYVLEHLGGVPPDLLQIDVEGADGYLLSLFPFERVRPALVHFEIKNLGRSQKEVALDLLGRHGYRVAPSGDEDALATLI